MATKPLMHCFQILALFFFLNIESTLSQNGTSAPSDPATTPSNGSLDTSTTGNQSSYSTPTPRANITTPSPTSTPGGLSTEVMIGIGVGATLVVILIVVLVVCKCCCKKPSVVPVTQDHAT